jgi:hypothetical protein
MARGAIHPDDEAVAHGRLEAYSDVLDMVEGLIAHEATP